MVNEVEWPASGDRFARGSGRDLAPIWWYLRAHRFGYLAIELVLAVPVLALALHSTRGIGTLFDIQTATPLSVFVAVGLGALAATTWGTAGGAHEDALLTREPGRLRAIHPVLAVTAACVAAVLAALIAGANANQIVDLVRTTIGVSALGFLSAAVFGGKVGWLGPLVFALAINGFGTSDGVNRWWNFIMRAPGDLLGWGVVGGLVAAAALAIYRATR